MSHNLWSGLEGRRLNSTLLLYLASTIFVGVATFGAALFGSRDIAIRLVPFVAAALVLLQHICRRLSLPVDLSQVDSVLTAVGLVIPTRIMNEEVGDAREAISKLAERGAPPWLIYTKLTSSVFWILLASVREVLTVTKKKPN